ncbi:MAG: hypothetical protein Q9M92_02275 [Enterobacterales bacterium]|nr:hypothetical protein [Enterobacterales bacterium]
MKKLISIVLFSFIFVGCSNKQLYQAGQDYQTSLCVEQSASQQKHNTCFETNKKTYQEYDKERKETIKKHPLSSL